MIFTFYSYKGGVGRSMALANVAQLFYQAGLKVLVMDWDLEAPGIERFFFEKPEEAERLLSRPGLMDMIQTYQQRLADPSHANGDSEFQALPNDTITPFISDIYSDPDSEGKLWLLSAGKRDGKYLDTYTSTVRSFDWMDFYKRWLGGTFINWFRSKLDEIADVVLIDSRTGLSEIGGICTYQLADVVVMLCAPNQQSIDGTFEMAQRLKDPQVAELRQDRPLEILVIPARVEITAETDLLADAKDRFTATFGKQSYIPEKVPQTTAIQWGEFLWDLKIPYVPKYSFKERIAVLEHRPESELLKAPFNKLVTVLTNLAPEKSKLSGSLLRDDSIFPNPLSRKYQPKNTIKVFIVSPSDVMDLREIAFEVVENVNRVIARLNIPIMLEVFSWEKIYPDAGPPQNVILRQIPIDRCDIFIAILWRRFGTLPGSVRPSDGMPYLSGTEQEIDEAFAARKSSDNNRPVIMLYHKTDEPAHKMTVAEIGHYNHVNQYLKQCGPQGEHPALVKDFKAKSFRSLLQEHLLQIVGELWNSRRFTDSQTLEREKIPSAETATDSQTQWLNKISLRANPFKYWLAQDERQSLPKYYVPLKEIGLRDFVYEEQPWIIFAGAGYGKTATRALLASRTFPDDSTSKILSVEFGIDELTKVLNIAGGSLEAIQADHFVHVLESEVRERAPQIREFLPKPIPQHLLKRPSNTDPRHRLVQIVAAVQAAKFDRLLCLIDEVDELVATHGKPDQIVNFLRSILIPAVREVKGITFGYLLPQYLEHDLKNQYDLFRLDRCRIISLKWNVKDIQRLIRQRLIYWSKDTFTPYESLGQLCEDNEKLAETIDADLTGLAEGNPRAALWLANHLIELHCSTDQFPQFIQPETWSQVQVDWWAGGRAQIFGAVEGPKRLYLLHNKIFFGGRELVLSKRHFAILSYLLQKDDICTTSELAHAASSDSASPKVKPRSIAETIRRLKFELQKQNVDPNWIQTIRGRGFQLRKPTLTG